MYYLYVAIFGAFGAATRYWMSSAFHNGAFPYNTLLVNVMGCFLLAIVVKYVTTLPKLPKNLVNGLGTGFLGSFTTFSAFSTEVSGLITRGAFFPAGCYIFASLAGGFLAVGLGFYVSGRLTGRREPGEEW